MVCKREDYWIEVVGLPLDVNERTPSFRFYLTVNLGLTKEESFLLHERIKPLLTRTNLFHLTNQARPDFYFKEPFIVEFLGSSFRPVSDHFALRHARIIRIHLDRGRRESFTWQEYQKIAQETTTPSPSSNPDFPLGNRLLTRGSCPIKGTSRVSLHVSTSFPLKQYRLGTSTLAIWDKSSGDKDKRLSDASALASSQPGDKKLLVDGREDEIIVIPPCEQEDEKEAIVLPDSQTTEESQNV